MVVRAQELARYEKFGFVHVEGMFSDEEVAEISDHATEDLGTPSERRVLEADGDSVRAVHGSHLARPFFSGLARLPRLLNIAEQILKSNVYVHQFKINAKSARGGEAWDWHQDSFFWRAEDGMVDMKAVNVVIHLDEVTDANGPLLLVPGSHREGDLATRTRSSSPWESTVSVKLKHEINRTDLATACGRSRIEAVKGRAGSVLIFHPSLLHGSTANMSPFDRRLLILSYNSVRNRLADVPDPRPEFLAARQCVDVLTVLDDDTLVSAASNAELVSTVPEA